MRLVSQEDTGHHREGVPMPNDSSPTDRLYDFKALIQTYIVTTSFKPRAGLTDYEKDCHKYYSTLLAKLEELLGVRLSERSCILPGNRRASRIYPFFRTTVDSLRAIQTPLTGWDEAGFLRDVDESGETGQDVRRAMTKINELSSESRRAHYQMLYALFECMYGKIETVVSSEQLRHAGFDDAQLPVAGPYD
jgi:hypothetical protein